MIADSCEWVEASGTTPAKCQKRTATPEEAIKAYCQLVEKPETNCASTFGCAYLNSACTHFLVVQLMSKQPRQSVKQFLMSVYQMEQPASKPKNVKITPTHNVNQLQVFLELRNVNGIVNKMFAEIMLVLKLMPL